MTYNVKFVQSVNIDAELFDVLGKFRIVSRMG